LNRRDISYAKILTVSLQTNLEVISRNCTTIYSRVGQHK